VIEGCNVCVNTGASTRIVGGPFDGYTLSCELVLRGKRRRREFALSSPTGTVFVEGDWPVVLRACERAAIRDLAGVPS
jgi:hypothetical protein